MRINPDLLSSHIFIAVTLISFGLYLAYYNSERNNAYLKKNKRIIVGSIISVTLGIVYLAMYVLQLNS